jgi:hypothetical protein
MKGYSVVNAPDWMYNNDDEVLDYFYGLANKMLPNWTQINAEHCSHPTCNQVEIVAYDAQDLRKGVLLTTVAEFKNWQNFTMRHEEYNVPKQPKQSYQPSYSITSTMSLHGVTREVTILVEPYKHGGWVAELSIENGEWGIGLGETYELAIEDLHNKLQNAINTYMIASRVLSQLEEGIKNHEQD